MIDLTKSQILRQMQPIRGATLGEVVMITGPNLLNEPWQCTIGTAAFQANLGVYRGISRDRSYYAIGGKVYSAIKVDEQLQIAAGESSKLPQRLGIEGLRAVMPQLGAEVIERDGNYGITFPVGAVDHMWLHSQDTGVFVGADEIRSYVGSELSGLMNNVLEDYLTRVKSKD